MDGFFRVWIRRYLRFYDGSIAARPWEPWHDGDLASCERAVRFGNPCCSFVILRYLETPYRR